MNMTFVELRMGLEKLGLSQVDFARLIGVTPRAVQFWLREERMIPNPVAVYLRLLLRLPNRELALELLRLHQIDTDIHNS